MRAGRGRHHRAAVERPFVRAAVLALGEVAVAAVAQREGGSVALRRVTSSSPQHGVGAQVAEVGLPVAHRVAVLGPDAAVLARPFAKNIATTAMIIIYLRLIRTLSSSR